jgi:hypothetical protein
MIDLYHAETNALIGNVTDAELQFLMDGLEEESPSDRDYFIDQNTIDMLTEDGRATDHLLQLLRKAVGTSDGVDIRWQRR